MFDYSLSKRFEDWFSHVFVPRTKQDTFNALIYYKMLSLSKFFAFTVKANGCRKKFLGTYHNILINVCNMSGM